MSRFRAALRAGGTLASCARGRTPCLDRPGHRSGEGADSVWPHLEQDGRERPDPPAPEQPEPTGKE